MPFTARNVWLPLLLVLATSPASAAIIGVEVLTTVLVSGSTVGHTLPGAGEAVVLNFSYDDSVADSIPVPGAANFLNALQSLSVEFPDSALVFSWAGGNSIISTVDDADSPGPGGTTAYTDSIVLGTTTGTISNTIGGDSIDAISFVFSETEFDAMPDLVVSDRPNPPFEFDGMELSAVTFQSNGLGGAPFFIDTVALVGGTGTVTSVPEPTVALLLLGSLGAGLQRARRRISGTLA